MLLSAVAEDVAWTPLERVVQLWAMVEWVIWMVLCFPETDVLLEIVVTEA
jgi:hypothetical protein